MKYRIERKDGTTDGLGDDILFDYKYEAIEAAEYAFRNDPASDKNGVWSWLQIAVIED